MRRAVNHSSKRRRIALRDRRDSRWVGFLLVSHLQHSAETHSMRFQAHLWPPIHSLVLARKFCVCPIPGSGIAGDPGSAPAPFVSRTDYQLLAAVDPSAEPVSPLTVLAGSERNSPCGAFRSYGISFGSSNLLDRGTIYHRRCEVCPLSACMLVAGSAHSSIATLPAPRMEHQQRVVRCLEKEGTNATRGTL
jgi:hypothetical protein